MTDDEYSLRYIGWRRVARRPGWDAAGDIGWASPRGFMCPLPTVESAIRLQDMIEEWDGRGPEKRTPR